MISDEEAIFLPSNRYDIWVKTIQNIIQEQTVRPGKNAQKLFLQDYTRKKSFEKTFEKNNIKNYLIVC